MRLVVTGALGHIGSALIRGLRANAFDEVLLVDNFATQRYASLFELPGDIPYRFVEADICHDDVDGMLAGSDVVVHLAAMTNAAGSFEIADQVERANLDGTARVAGAAARQGARFLFLSTTSVYGTQSQDEETLIEDCPPDRLRPQSPYAESKLRAERRLAELGHQAGLRYVICRFGTIFGTSIGMRFHTAVNRFVWEACVGTPLSVWRTAMHQKRPYLDLSDAIRAINFIIDRDLFQNEIYNVVTTNATVAEIVDVVKRYVPDVAVQYVDSPIMNQLSYVVSGEKFGLLGFVATGDLNTGIKRTVELLRGVRPGNWHTL